MPELPISIALEYPSMRIFDRAHGVSSNHFAVWIVSSEPPPTFS